MTSPAEKSAKQICGGVMSSRKGSDFEPNEELLAYLLVIRRLCGMTSSRLQICCADFLARDVIPVPKLLL